MTDPLILKTYMPVFKPVKLKVAMPTASAGPSFKPVKLKQSVKKDKSYSDKIDRLNHFEDRNKHESVGGVRYDLSIDLDQPLVDIVMKLGTAYGGKKVDWSDMNTAIGEVQSLYELLAKHSGKKVIKVPHGEIDSIINMADNLGKSAGHDHDVERKSISRDEYEYVLTSDMELDIIPSTGYKIEVISVKKWVLDKEDGEFQEDEELEDYAADISLDVKLVKK